MSSGVRRTNLNQWLQLLLFGSTTLFLIINSVSIFHVILSSDTAAAAASHHHHQNRSDYIPFVPNRTRRNSIQSLIVADPATTSLPATTSPPSLSSDMPSDTAASHPTATTLPPAILTVMASSNNYPAATSGPLVVASFVAPAADMQGSDVCEYEIIDFEQKKSTDAKMVGLKTSLFNELMEFQKQRGGAETLEELMAMPSKWDLRNNNDAQPKVTVLLNHFKRKTLCAQLEALKNQTLPFHSVWVLAFGSPNEASLRRVVQSFNNDDGITNDDDNVVDGKNQRIKFVGSTHDFKYYGRFQMALQAEGADFVYIVDDDMIPGSRMLEILTHIAGTEKYDNAVLGSIGRVLPFRQKDFTFPSYRKFGAKEAGLYLPDPAYDIAVDRMAQVDFLSSSWFLPVELVKTIFVETPFTFSTGEDLHLRGAGSFVVPVDPNDKATWGDSEHRLAQIAETTVIFKDTVKTRDEQWWRAMSRGYVTQWAAMYPQQIDALIYAHSVEDIASLEPLISSFRKTPQKKAFVVVAGGDLCPCVAAAQKLHCDLCPCVAAAQKLHWPASVCSERRFKIFDLEIGSVHRHDGDSPSQVSVVQEVFASMKGLLQIHNPALVIAPADIDDSVRQALSMAVSGHVPQSIVANATTSLVLLPRQSIPHSVWLTKLPIPVLRQWSRMRVSVSVITQNRPKSLKRLLDSLKMAHYVGDTINLTFNIDRAVDEETLRMVNEFEWEQGPKAVRRRIIQGGLIRAVSESWYPASDDDFGLLLEDDIEVSPWYYMWIKYALLAYYYGPAGGPMPELSSIALYTPRLVEVVKERPKWNATEAFGGNTPYLHQLPCSWGALFLPKHWREYYEYMGARYTDDAKQNPVQIPMSRTNGWQASWKKFLIDMMYLRGYVALYPNFPDQASFSTNHMEPGAHIGAAGNALKHNPQDFIVPLLRLDFWDLLPGGKLPPASRLPVIDLFNRRSSLPALRKAGAKLRQDLIACQVDGEVVVVDPVTGVPKGCAAKP